MLSESQVAKLMAGYSLGPEEQLRQTTFRMDLVRGWGLAEGQRILEIGCGQGDMTAVLMNAVGEKGSVTATDIADPSYGAPIDLGDSTKHLKEGPLGSRVDFRLGFDLKEASFESECFDVAVMTHCLWYFASYEGLKQTFSLLKGFANKICVSEWDLQPTGIEQQGHLLAVLIQGQIEAFKAESEANVRSPFTKEMVRRALEESGWKITDEAVVNSGDLADGRWEVEGTLRVSRQEMEELPMPEKMKTFIRSELDVLARLEQQGASKSLPSVSMVAER